MVTKIKELRTQRGMTQQQLAEPGPCVLPHHHLH